MLCVQNRSTELNYSMDDQDLCCRLFSDVRERRERSFISEHTHQPNPVHYGSFSIPAVTQSMIVPIKQAARQITCFQGTGILAKECVHGLLCVCDHRRLCVCRVSTVCACVCLHVIEQHLTAKD